MARADVPAAERVSADAFHDVELRLAPRGVPEPERRSPASSAGWIRRTERFLDTDPGGSWVAADDSAAVGEGLAGFATSVARERLWILATFAVRPSSQGHGIGRRLLSEVEAYGARCDRGLLAASDDDKALRRYHAAGFVLHPQMLFEGMVDRSLLPAVSGMREGLPDDREWMDDLDRELRGAPHGPDHATLAEMCRLVVTADRSGYAYLTAGGTYLLAARDAATGTRLLWECLASADGDFEVSHVTSANMWAADVALSARLAMRASGFLGVRGMDPPAPYIHSGPML
jgi:GNAT superfamily N-acetyltransferase